ncbi:MAG: hypothetical protein LBM72_03050 [Mycoplasmataceae bacterium]|jgi:hypothetical protein|nr:hypothetical protein [Mycoplasmataceae bacterium]
MNENYKLEIQFDYVLAKDQHISVAKLNAWLQETLSDCFVSNDGINWFVKDNDAQPYETLLGTVVGLFTNSNIIPRFAKTCKIYDYLEHKQENAMMTFKTQIKAYRI